jgi:cardiolipin synthase
MAEILWFYLFIGAYAVWVVLASVSLLLTRRSPTATLAWIFAFIALPVVSGVYYVMFGPRRLQRRKRRYGVARAMAARLEHLREAAARPSPSSRRAARPRRGRQAPRPGRAHVRARVQLLDDGDQKMAALEERVLAPSTTSTWSTTSGSPTRRHAFPRPARARPRRGRRGARALRLGGLAAPEDALLEAAARAGGEVLAFNPLRLSFASLHFANFRTHRKITICDGNVGFLGGINMHDPASATRSGKDAWRDAPRAHRRRAGVAPAAALPRELDLLRRQVPPDRARDGEVFPGLDAGGQGAAGAGDRLGARRRERAAARVLPRGDVHRAKSASGSRLPT